MPKFTKSKRAPKRRFKTRRRRVARVPRAPRYAGGLTIKRVSNCNGMANVVVDGSVVSKYLDNFAVTTTIGAGLTTYGAIVCSFRLADVVSYTEFTQLYDQYKILGVKVRMIPFQTVAATAAAPSSAAGQPAFLIHSVVDYDDADLPVASNTGVDNFRQYPNYKVKNVFSRMGGAISRFLRPKLRGLVYKSGEASAPTTGYQSLKASWLDCDNPDPPHYGLKYIIECISGGSVATMMFKMDCTWYLQFKNPR